MTDAHASCVSLQAPTAPAYALEMMLVGSAVAMATATWYLAWFCVALVLSLTSSCCDYFSYKVRAAVAAGCSGQVSERYKASSAHDL